MAEVKELKEHINAVVEARQLAQEITTRRTEAYDKWILDHAQLLLNEKDARTACVEAEDTLREKTLQVYTETGNKAPEIGVGIRVRTVLDYEDNEAMTWAMEHKLALKLDASAFEKIAKTSNLMFVKITEEPQATIATELAKVE